MGINDINNDSYPWMLDEVELIKKAFSKKIPIIGVCLGAQLLAYSQGGSVEPILDRLSNKAFPEIGWGSIELTHSKSNRSFETFFIDPFYVLHWHGDRILLPNNAHLIASTAFCKEQLFKIGESSYGIQFHAEIDHMMPFTWIQEDSEFIQLALGQQAKDFLIEQQVQYGNKSMHKRLKFLTSIFEMLGF